MSHPARARARLLDLLAQRVGYETLETRGSHRLDFREVDVTDMKESLQMASVTGASLWATEPDTQRDAGLCVSMVEEWSPFPALSLRLAAQAWAETEEGGGQC